MGETMKCRHCLRTIHPEGPSCTLVDDTGGDVCGVSSAYTEGENLPHELMSKNFAMSEFDYELVIPFKTRAELNDAERGRIMLNALDCCFYGTIPIHPLNASVRSLTSKEKPL